MAYVVVEYKPVVVKTFDTEKDAQTFFDSPEYLESPPGEAVWGELWEVDDDGKKVGNRLNWWG